MSILTAEQIALVAAHPKVKTALTPANFDAQLKGRLYDILSSLVPELGEDMDAAGNSQRTCTMTDATEFYWGTSGRGNPTAKAKIEAAARLGFLTLLQKGRTSRVGISARGYALWLELDGTRGAPTEPVK